MVDIRVWETDTTLHISCKGHADFSPQGQPDIVCAAVSALTFTLCNALARCDGFECQIASGDVSLCCDKTQGAHWILDTISLGFHGLMGQYPDHVYIDDTRERPLEGEYHV